MEILVVKILVQEYKIQLMFQTLKFEIKDFKYKFKKKKYNKNHFIIAKRPILLEKFIIITIINKIQQ